MNNLAIHILRHFWDRW